MSSKTSAVTMFIRIVFFFFCITFAACHIFSTCTSDRTSDDKSWEAKLYEDLCFSYSDIAPPVKNVSQNIQVKTRMMLKYFRFDKTEELLTIHSWLVLMWNDEFRLWNSSDYGGIADVVVSSFQIWTPNLNLLNSVETQFYRDYIYTLCTIDNGGIVLCVPQITHTAICNTKLTNWPFDTQICTLKFGVDEIDKVNFTVMDPAISSMGAEENSGWQLIHTSIHQNHTYGGKNLIEFQFTIHRVGGGLSAIIVLPTIAVSLLTIVSLILDFKDYVRFIIVTFSLLCHLVCLQRHVLFIPTHSAYTPLVILFHRNSIALTCIALLITLLLMWIRSRVVPPPMFIVGVTDYVLNSRGKRFVFTNWQWEVNVSDEAEVQAVEQWNRFANLFNSALVFIFGIIYLALLAAYMPY